MNLQGKLTEIFQEKIITDKFKKREFILETTDTKFTQTIAMECQQERVDLLDSYKTGDMVDVEFNINGRKWINPQGEAKYFNTLVCWKIQKLKQEEVQTDISSMVETDDSDLPF